MLTRRSFIQKCALAAGTLIVIDAIPFGNIPKAYAENLTGSGTGNWIFDAALGVYKNPQFTEKLLRRASRQGGFRWKGTMRAMPKGDMWFDNNAGIFRNLNPKIQEFSRGFEIRYMHDDWYADKVVEQLTAMNKLQKTWYQTPELRMAIPSDFGQQRLVAWYGVAKV